MTLTSDQMAQAILRDTHKRGQDLRNNLPGEIRKWLHSTPWFFTAYPTQNEQNVIYWKVRKRALQRMSKKKKVGSNTHINGPLASKDPRQSRFSF